MFGECQCRTVISECAERAASRLLSTLGATGRVAVLLLTTAGVGVLHAADAGPPDLRVFEFTCQFEIAMGQGRLDGLMASDGSRHRIAIYWIEPAIFRESASLLRYSDFIFAAEDVHYCVYGVSGARTFPLSGTALDPLLPRQNSVESVVRSGLTIVSRIECEHELALTPLAVGKFFRGSRGQAQHIYEVLAGEADSNDLSGNTPSDVEILNALPYGREYSKETRSDGSIVWRARRALNGQPLVSVAVKPLAGVEKNHCAGVFDPESLGQWTLIPEPYLIYWSFDHAYLELSNSPDERTASRDLYDKIEAYLDNNKPPAHVCRALAQVHFKTALMSDDMNRVCRSAQASVAGLCRDDSVDGYEGLLELARIAGKIEKRYPQQAEESLRPLVEQMVKHAGCEAMDGLNRLMPAINANNWFLYGKLLLGEIRAQGLAQAGTLGPVAVRLEALRLARDRRLPDPCESPATVKRYLAQLDADPPRGEIDMNDLRHILETGLAKHYTDAQSKAKRMVVENVIGSIRLIVGEGPFCGDQTPLIESIERFSGLYLVVDKTSEPIDTVLATFLGLCFCDISTPQDHAMLSSQFHKLCAELQSQANTMLSERGLRSLVTPEDVRAEFARYEKVFHRYLDDPLWPAFKFPLTANEEVRFASKLKLRFAQLEPLLDEMSLKVKYGGGSPRLKQRTLYEISGAAEQLLPEMAFLRRPPYPGLSCQYRTRYGFTAVIRGSPYKECERPREKFKAMKYFHLGHRLEEVVKRERELTRLAGRPSEGPEAPPTEQEAVDHEAGRSTDSERLR